MGVFKLGKMTFGSLFKKPETVLYPIETKPQPAGLQDHIEIDVSTCILCGLCEKSCPTDCITVDKATSTWSTNPFACIQCGYCTLKCPKKCLNLLPGYQEPGAEKVEELRHRDVPAPAPKAAGGAAGAAPSSGGYPKADTEKCVFCSLCAKKCPQSAINVNRAEKQWELNREACVKCGLCAENCPKKCISLS